MCIVIAVIGKFYYVRGCCDSGLRLLVITMDKGSR